MATPNVDHLFGIEPWDPRANDATTDAVKTIGDKLHLVADLTGRVAADLGMNGATAEAAAGELDSLTTRVRRSAEGMHSIAQSRTTVTTAGRHAQDTSKQLQKQLKTIEKYYKLTASSAQTNPLGNVMLAQAEQKRAAAHAKLEERASTELASLDHVAAAEGKGLPFQPEEQSFASGHGQASEGTSGTGGGRDPRSPRGSASGGAEGHVSSGPGQNVGLPRSATEWKATGLGEAVGSSGHANETFIPQRSPSTDPGIGLQGSHYAPQHVDDHGGALRSGPVRPSGLDSPAVHNPLAVAATMTGGAVGYKVFQAIRAAKAAPAAPVSPRTAVQSGAATRAAPSPRGSGILRGTTTAARNPVSGTSPSSSRGGASGIARPTAPSASGRSSGILRGATTAPRATAAASTGSSVSRSGIVRGATTASRARTNDPAVSRTNGTGSYNRTGSTVSASRNTAGSQTASRTTSQTPERTAGTSRSGPRTAGGASATRAGQSRVARSTSAGRSLDARAASPSRGTDSSNQRVASRQALSGLTGKHARRPGKKKDSSGSDLREDKNISAYEPDRRITFLPAGPHPTDNSSR